MSSYLWTTRTGAFYLTCLHKSHRKMSSKYSCRCVVTCSYVTFFHTLTAITNSLRLKNQHFIIIIYPLTARVVGAPQHLKPATKHVEIWHKNTLHLLRVFWIFFQNAGSQLCFRFFPQAKQRWKVKIFSSFGKRSWLSCGHKVRSIIYCHQTRSGAVLRQVHLICPLDQPRTCWCRSVD